MFKSVLKSIKNNRYYYLIVLLFIGLFLQLIQKRNMGVSSLKKSFEFNFLKFYTSLTILFGILYFILPFYMTNALLNLEQLPLFNKPFVIFFGALIFMIMTSLVSFIWWFYNRAYSLCVSQIGYEAFPPPYKYYFLKINSLFIRFIAFVIFVMSLSTPYMLHLQSSFSNIFNVVVSLLFMIYYFTDRFENKLDFENAKVMYPNNCVRFFSFLFPIVVGMTLFGVQYAILRMSM